MARKRPQGRTSTTRTPQVRPEPKPPAEPHHLHITRYERSGPLPPPDELREYNDIVVDGAERIFLRWEQQGDHRIAMERKVITSDIWRGWAGFAASVVLDLLFLLVSWDLVRNNHDFGGAALAVTATIHLSIGGVSLYTIRRREQSRKERREELEQQRH